ncbi:bifunctional metallophosphatase/5'-nucleotidase [Antrihabitans cavernicola]|uniref:Bifunctional metallophosphatase/5'-nucleotidase n=1 Tax=Antrihabitans cavernicola TaxID=2495913 RepID=A0A5A7SFI9_9NOCA|nr:5'-nucleotidase C-terminal domain-containing protein [Spelaeibacter cavernicola]KAA0024586.1 bifunctional metallophosphatase/5'-nucleotidase [Spelaeibacter cavernicola]
MPKHAAACAVAVLVATLAACTLFTGGVAAAQNPDVLAVRLLAFNDLHGTLAPPQGSAGEVVGADGSAIAAGGAAYLAAYVDQLRSQASNSLLYSVGDNWGASPLESSLFHDEPTVDLLNSMGVAASGIGNHELDAGFAEFQRMQRGGCNPVDGCLFTDTFSGARFPMLAANLTFANGVPATLPFNVNYVDGIPIGVIGVLPENSPKIIAAGRTAGLAFGDELQAIDRTADLLDFFGVKAITVLLHRGDDSSPGSPDDCNLTTNSARRIAQLASPKVDVVFSAAGNNQYNCRVDDPLGNPRVFMQGASNGRVLSVVDLGIDRSTRDVLRDRTNSFNQIVGRNIAPDPAAKAIVDRASAKAAAVSKRVVGSTADQVVRQAAPSGESPLGNLIADAQLAASAPVGAQLALTNAGGIRADLGSGTISYGDIHNVQPFDNSIRVVSMTGAQIDDALEQQFQQRDDGTALRDVLAPSANVSYELHSAAHPGTRIVNLSIDGRPVVRDAVYRVAVNEFLAGGGDGFAAFRSARDSVDVGKDADLLAAYLGARGPVVAPATNRIKAAG